jgi:hypothetical protein
MTARYSMTEGPYLDGYVTFKIVLGRTFPNEESAPPQDVTEACVALMNADQVIQTDDDDSGMLFEYVDGFGKCMNDGDMPFGLGDLANYLVAVLRLPLAYEADEVDEALDGGVL